MDLHIKKIVSYAFNNNIITLEDAINVQMPNEGVIFHFDSQYLSYNLFKNMLKNEIIQSFSKKKCSYDNVYIEFFPYHLNDI